MAGIVHHMLYGLHGVYFEWVQSKSNWADGVSRDGMGDGLGSRPWIPAELRAAPVPPLAAAARGACSCLRVLVVRWECGGSVRRAPVPGHRSLSDAAAMGSLKADTNALP